MQKIRIIFFIDGFNLYHSIKGLGNNFNHLKWLDLKKICQQFAPEPQFDIKGIYYFSAFAEWRPDAFRRHKIYVSALESTGVICKLGTFYSQNKRCKYCNSQWKKHEEKQTDVSLALSIIDLAYKDKFDRAVIISADSDFVPAINLVRQNFKEKEIRVLTPIGRKHGWHLLRASGGENKAKKIEMIHIESSLLPKEIKLKSGSKILRPQEYDIAQ